MVSEDIKERVVAYLTHQAKKEVPDIRALIERERARLIDALDGLSEAQASWKPRPDEWSVKDILRHVLSAERGVTGIVASLAGGETPGREPRAGTQDPDESVTLSRLIEGLHDERRKLLEVVDSLSPSADLTTTSPHPFFGPLNCKAWVAFQRIHDGDHTGQIEKIVAADGFPGM